MSSLAQQQQALLATLFGDLAEDAALNIAASPYLNWARGIKVYQSNGHALAERALQSAYPVLSQLLGVESFAALARALWHASPPHCGDVAQWGSDLGTFVRASAQLADVPYLADVAALEWALHTCATAADVDLDAASLALLQTHDPLDLALRLGPGCHPLHSAWPVVSIWQAHNTAAPDFQKAASLLHDGVAEDALIWRAGLRPQVRLALAGEIAFVTALLSGQSLGAALANAQALDITAWLPWAVQSGLLLGVAMMENDPSRHGTDATSNPNPGESHDLIPL